MTKVILFLLDLLKPFFVYWKVNYSQLRAILETKLMMDNRRQTVRLNNRKTEKNNVFFWTLVVYSIFGAFVAIAIVGAPFMLGMLVFFAFLMVMIAMTLITDFSSILLDTSDNSIILPRPVDARTFYAARVTHILLYLGQLTVCIVFFPCIAIMIKYAAWLLIPFVVGIVLSVLFAVFLTNSIYLLIMRFADEEKMKSIINYFQIGMAIFIMGGYQIGARLLTSFDYADKMVDLQWWSYFVPPIWMAAMMDTLYTKALDNPHLILSGLALLVPLISIYVTNRWLTPFYNRKIATMDGNQGSTSGERTKTGNLIGRIGKLITTNAREEGAFNFVFKMLARDNKIKLKIYPGFGLIFVFGFLFLFKDKGSLAATWANLPDTSYYVLLLYLPFMIVQTAIYEIPYSEDFKASWIYYSSPLEKPGEILTGTAKAVFVQLFMPIYIIVSIGVLFIWKTAAVDDILFAFINNYLIFQILLNVLNRYLPLSMAPSARNQAGNLLRGLLMMICTGIPAIAHYFMANKPWLLVAALPFELIVIHFLERNYRNTTWSRIKF